MTMGIQEMFDKAATHLLVQNERAGSRGNCAYYHPNGTKCVVGALIQRHAYHPRIERQRVSTPPVIDALIASGVLSGDYSDEERTKRALLGKLQQMHDLDPVELWPDQLRDVARRYCLSTRALRDVTAYTEGKRRSMRDRDDYRRPIRFEPPPRMWIDELEVMPSFDMTPIGDFSKATLQVHVDPVTGWKTPIHAPMLPPASLYHPKFHDDEHERVERMAMYAAQEALKKASMAELNFA